MQIIVHSRQTVKDADPDVPYVVISIRSSNDKTTPELKDNPLRLQVLPLKFDDVEADTGRGIFRDKHVEWLTNFVNDYKDKAQLILVHCEAGISRSSAVAAALSLWLNGTDEPFMTGCGPNGRFFPNQRILRMLKQTWMPLPFSGEIDK